MLVNNTVFQVNLSIFEIMLLYYVQTRTCFSVVVIHVNWGSSFQSRLQHPQLNVS